MWTLLSSSTQSQQPIKTDGNSCPDKSIRELLKLTNPKLFARPFQEGFISSPVELVLIDYRWNDGSVERLWLVDPNATDLTEVEFRPCTGPIIQK